MQAKEILFGTVVTEEVRDDGSSDTIEEIRQHGNVVDRFIRYRESLKFTDETQVLGAFIELLDMIKNPKIFNPIFEAVKNPKTGRYEKGYRSWCEKVDFAPRPA